jgi:hypothetical protein
VVRLGRVSAEARMIGDVVGAVKPSKKTSAEESKLGIRWQSLLLCDEEEGSKKSDEKMIFDLQMANKLFV